MIKKINKEEIEEKKNNININKEKHIRITKDTIIQNLTLENLDGEIWKDIEGFEGLYRISNKGRVKSLRRLKTYPNVKIARTPHYTQEIILRIQRCNFDYLYVSLNKGGKDCYNKKLHRLVAEAFILNPNQFQVNHKDGNKDNNNVENLEWCDASHNILHSYRLGLISKKGEKSSSAKLKEQDIINIRNVFKNTKYHGQIKDLAKQYKVTRGTISDIIHKRLWPHVN